MRKWNHAQFQARILQRLDDLNTSGREVSLRIGKHQGAISDWTTSTSAPLLRDIPDLAEALECEPAWLAFGVGPVTEAESKLLDAARRFNPPQNEAILKVIEALPMPRKMQ